MTPAEIFKTNVEEDAQAKRLISTLLDYFPQYKINFDLQDCDKILRVEGKQVPPEKIIEVITGNGYQCIMLD